MTRVMTACTRNEKQPFKRRQRRRSRCSCAWTREREQEKVVVIRTAVWQQSKGVPLSLVTGKGANKTSKGSAAVAAGAFEGGGGPPPVRGQGNSASVWCVHVGSRIAVSGSRTREQWGWRALQTGTGSQRAESVALLLFSPLSSGCSPLEGSLARTNDFIMHCLGTVERAEQRVLSVVAVGERGCHQWAHAHGERREPWRLGRGGLHVADAVLAGAVHIHGARAVRWEGLC